MSQLSSPGSWWPGQPGGKGDEWGGEVNGGGSGMSRNNANSRRDSDSQSDVTSDGLNPNR